MDLSLLKNLSAARILVVGDVMLDRYWYGDTGRISPEAPVPVVKVSKFEDKAGGAANVAKNIARLDGKVGLLGLIGEDESGQILETILKGEKINSQLVSVCDLPTISKMRVISRHQQLVRLDLEETFTQQHSQLLLNRLELVLDEYDFIVFSDYNKGSLSLIKEMVSLAKEAGKTVLVDPKSSDLHLYKGADYITPNLNEFKLAGGKTDSEQMLTRSV